MYSSRRPFHPSRLWDLVSKPFCVLQPGAEEEEEDDEDEDEEVEEVDDEEWNAEIDIEMEEGSDNTENTEEDEDEEEDGDETPETMLARMKAEKQSMNLPARAAFKKQSDVWKGVLRSKGFCWLATRPGVHGEWSQAGVSIFLNFRPSLGVYLTFSPLTPPLLESTSNNIGRELGPEHPVLTSL